MSQCIPQTLDFLSYHEPLGTVLAVCTALLFLLALAILGIIIRHHHTPIVRASNRRLRYLLLSSSALCFLCLFLFVGHPSPLTCAVRQAAFGVTFTACVSTVLAKTSWWWQPSRPQDQTSTSGSGQGQSSLAASQVSVPWSRQSYVFSG